jgi:LDH2 family malate/lactate/ureidoglycolate dehydrogenase
MARASEAEARAFAARVLEAIGMPPEDAELTARCLVAADLRGMPGHGVLRLIQYADTVAAGEVRAAPDVRVLRREGTSALVDAGGGYGYRPTMLACELAAELAHEHGIGVAGVRDSHHFGMAGLYAEELAARGLAGIVLTNAQPIMAPPGLTAPLLGNNPLAIAVPRAAPHPPLVLDMAMSQTALGRIRLAAAEGRPIPEGWALDAQGRPTTDAASALDAGLLAPAGGHKGLALALMIDVLAGVLTGSPAGRDADAHGRPEGGVGHLVIALRTDLFVAPEAFAGGLEDLLAGLRAQGTADAPVLFPGDPEQAAQERLRREGVPVSDELAAGLDALAARLDVLALPRSPG